MIEPILIIMIGYVTLTVIACYVVKKCADDDEDCDVYVNMLGFGSVELTTCT